MLKKKLVRQKGKLNLSLYFQGFEKGDRVAVKRELSLQPKFPKQIQGRSGVVEGSRGTSYVIKMNDINKGKTYIIHPVHLRKLK